MPAIFLIAGASKGVNMRYEKRGVLKNERLYYLCDSRTVVGNCLQFWRKGGSGYTYNLDDCEVYPESVAFAMHRSRKSDYPIPKDVVDSLAERHLDHQDYDHYLETWRSVEAQKNSEESQSLRTTSANQNASSTSVAPAERPAR